MKPAQIKENHTKYNLQSWSKQSGLNPVAAERGDGIYIYGFDGKRYSDMSSQLVNLNVGHNCRPVIEAIKEQAEKYCYISPSYASEPRSVLAERLVKNSPDNMAKVFFTNGGADANENAIKMARMYTGRNKVFSRYRSYHGSTFGAGNLTGEPRRYPLEPGIPGFVKFFDPYLYRDGINWESEQKASEYYVRRLREQIVYENPDDVAAIILETVTGSNGIIIPPAGYLAGVREICDEFGIMLICDEVMTGFYRTGTFWAFQNWNIKPDLISFAKGVTGGYVQLGGVVVSRAIAEYFDGNFLSCGLTYSGHPLACAAGIACLDFYRDNNIAENVIATGKVLEELLETIKVKHSCVGDVRSIGLFAAAELVTDKSTRNPLVPYGKDPDGKMAKITGALKDKGFMTYSHENMVFIAPPLIITAEQLREELEKLDEVLGNI
jgi:taurine--2-oxoglutarate transaminase